MTKLSRMVGGLNGSLLFGSVSLLITLLLWPLFFSIPAHINWLMLIFLGFLGAGITALFCYALKIGKIPIIIPITSAWAIITSSLGIVVLHESVSWLKIFCIIVVVVGIIVLSIDWKTINKSFLSLLAPGVIPALIVVVGWGISFFLLGPASKEMGWFFTTLGNRVFIVLFLILFFLKQRSQDKDIITKRKVPWKLVFMVALVDVFAFTSYNLAVSHYEVSYVSIISSTYPLLTVTFASLFMGEKTNLIQKLGIAMVILGVIGLQIH